MINRRDFIKSASISSLAAVGGLILPSESYAESRGIICNGDHSYNGLDISCSKKDATIWENPNADFFFYQTSNGPAILNVDESIPSVGVGKENGNFSFAARTGNKKDLELSLYFLKRAEPGGFSYPEGFSFVNIQLDKGEVALYKRKDWRCPIIFFDGEGHVDSCSNSVEIEDSGRRTSAYSMPAPDGVRRSVELVVSPRFSQDQYLFQNGRIYKMPNKNYGKNLHR